MRTPIILTVLFLAACGQNSGEKKTVTDTSKTSNGSTKTVVTKDFTLTGIVPGAAQINALLKTNFGEKWHVVNDKESGWIQDAFDFFVTPQRKKDPDYPYISRGDYDCDGTPDIAALVTDSQNKEVKIVYILKEGKTFNWWKEDMKGTAIINLPKSEVTGFEGDIDKEKKVQMKCDGIEAVWFEQSSFVIYWNGRGFDNIWTSD